jgi:hypothetical protein
MTGNITERRDVGIPSVLARICAIGFMPIMLMALQSDNNPLELFNVYYSLVALETYVLLQLFSAKENVGFSGAPREHTLNKWQRFIGNRVAGCRESESACICMYICMLYMYIRICVYIAYVCMYVCVYVCMYICMLCMYIRMYVCILRMYVCMCVYMVCKGRGKAIPLQSWTGL